MGYLIILAVVLFAIAIAIHPLFIMWFQGVFSRSWEDECDTCGEIRKCYPVQRHGPQTGMISTTIETSCPKCGISVDPNYAAHLPEKLGLS